MQRLEEPDIRANYHLHTEHSHCCENITTTRLAEFLPEWPHTIAITDHSAHLAFEWEMIGKLNTDGAPELLAACREGARVRFHRYLERVRTLPGGRVLAGTELDITPDGRPVFDEDLLAELDILVGAVHAVAAVRHKLSTEEILAEWRFQNRALMRLGVAILAHPFRYLVQNNVPVPPDEVARLVEDAAQYGTALELNSHYLCTDFDREMIRRCSDRGVRIAIGTDAHRWEEITEFGYHERILNECGITTAAQRAALLFQPTL